MTRTTQIPTTVTLPEGAPPCCCGEATVCPPNTVHPESFTISGFTDQLNINGVIIYGWSLLNGTHPWVAYVGETHQEATYRVWDTVAPIEHARYWLVLHVSFTCEIVDGERVFTLCYRYGISELGWCGITSIDGLVITGEQYPTGPYEISSACPQSPITITLNWEPD